MEEVKVADGIIKPGDIFYLVFYTEDIEDSLERIKYTGGIVTDTRGHKYINIQYPDGEFEDGDDEDDIMTTSILEERAFIDKRKANMFVRLKG